MEWDEEWSDEWRVVEGEEKKVTSRGWEWSGRRIEGRGEEKKKMWDWKKVN